MVIKFFGTRGSIPVPGKKTLKYGGNTPCISISSGKNDLIIIDAGTGIRVLGKEISASGSPKKIKLFISHMHWDHVQGLPFFDPFYINDFSIDIYSGENETLSEKGIIETQWHPFFFPVSRENLQADISFNKIIPGEKKIFNNIVVEAINVHHSNGTLAFKITECNKTIIYMTDNEIYYDVENDKISFQTILEKNKQLVDFCKGADYLIHDSMYTIKDFKTKLGWGHSNNKALAYFSIISEVKNLILFHYDPDYYDKDVEKMHKQTVAIIKKNKGITKCIASYESLEIKL